MVILNATNEVVLALQPKPNFGLLHLWSTLGIKRYTVSQNGEFGKIYENSSDSQDLFFFVFCFLLQKITQKKLNIVLANIY